MIHNDVLNQLQYLIKTTAPPLLEVAQTAVEAPEWVPGQRLPVHVMAALPGGRFQVLVQDKQLDMNLPSNTQPGDTLELTFVAAQPRLTFVLTRDLSAALPQQTQTPVSLSDTARFIGALVQRAAGEPAQSPQPATVAGSQPLLDAPPTDPARLAVALRETLGQSGLFYESHQAQWVAGQRSLQTLLQEPQAQLSAPPAAGTSSPGTPSATPGTEKPVMTVSRGEAGSLAGLGAGLPGLGDEPVHPQAVPLVQSQLQALDSRQLLWQGQVWPGQEMDWRVEERPAREPEEDEPAKWATRLRLVLPRLGEVTARIGLYPGGLSLHIESSEVAAGELRAGQPRLAAALDQAGLKLAGLQVGRQGGA